MSVSYRGKFVYILLGAALENVFTKISIHLTIQGLGCFREGILLTVQG